jgi:surfactin synthase thioesterase subunit
MSDTEILAVVRKFGGIPEQGLLRRDWQERFLPCLRADFGLNNPYLAQPAHRIALPGVGPGWGCRPGGRTG